MACDLCLRGRALCAFLALGSKMWHACARGFGLGALLLQSNGTMTTELANTMLCLVRLVRWAARLLATGWQR